MKWISGIKPDLDPKMKNPKIRNWIPGLLFNKSKVWSKLIKGCRNQNLSCLYLNILNFIFKLWYSIQKLCWYDVIEYFRFLMKLCCRLLFVGPTFFNFLTSIMNFPFKYSSIQIVYNHVRETWLEKGQEIFILSLKRR